MNKGIESSNRKDSMIELWPQHLLCMRCMNGGGRLGFMERHKLAAVLDVIRNNPDVHIKLEGAFDEIGARTEVFYEQTPQERKRDLDVLRRLGLVPGSVRTARTLYQLIDERIKDLDGICSFGISSPDDWTDCTLASQNCYRDGANGVIAVRDRQDMHASKIQSCIDINSEKHLYIRAHHLLCMVCFIGGKHAGVPLQEDNLYEVWEKMQKEPDIPVTVVEGCSKCMICPPCDGYDEERGICVFLCGLKDRYKDLSVFQKLGLKPGDTMPARELYKLIFGKIKDIAGICRFDEETAPEWRNCPTHEPGTYGKGRAIGMGQFGFREEDVD